MFFFYKHWFISHVGSRQATSTRLGLTFVTRARILTRDGTGIDLSESYKLINLKNLSLRSNRTDLACVKTRHWIW